MAATATAGKFEHRLTVLLPGQLPELVDRAAEKAFSTRSEFVRRAIIDRLKADGALAADAA